MSSLVNSITVPEQAYESEARQHSIELLPVNGKSQREDIAVMQTEILQSPSDEQETSDYFMRRRQPHQEPESPKEDESRALMYGTEQNIDTFPDGGTQANLVLLGSFIGLIADFGIANSLGAIESKSTLGWVFSLHLGVMYFGGVFFGELFDKFGSRRPMIAGTLITCVGLLCTAESRTLYQFILSFSIVTALGTSIAMSPLIGALSHWFLKKRALACSIATIGGLVGSAVFTVMLQRLYGKIGFKNAIRVLACICFILMAVSSVLVKERTTTRNNDEQEDVEKISVQRKVVNYFKGALDFSIITDTKFISTCLAVFLSEVISMTTLTYLASFAITNGISDATSYLMLTLVNVAGIPSRLLSGMLADKYGRFNVMCLSSTLTTIFIFGLWYPAHDAKLLYAFSILFGISSSAVISLIPACTGQICSADRFGKVYGTLYFFLGFLTILGMYFATLVIAEGTVTNYSNFVLFEGALSALSILVWIWARYCSVGWQWCKF
ncbi:MCH4 Probable transporter MCH4 [Candida maltosa Xu316]